MVELKNKKIMRMHNKSIPVVSFATVDANLWAINIIDTDMDIKEYLGLVFSKLGFKSLDNIILSVGDKINNDFVCLVNDTDIYNIKFGDMSLSHADTEIILSSFNKTLKYKCESSLKAELDMIISLGSYSLDFSNDRKYTRYLSKEKAVFTISNNDYSLELVFDKPNDKFLPLFDENGTYSKYRLDNEENLYEFLKIIDFSKSIIDIYNDVSEIVSEDISVFPEFSLKLIKSENGKNFVNDLIKIVNGTLVEFLVTYSDRNVRVNILQNGDYSYDILGNEKVPVDFKMVSQEGKVSCNFSCDEEYNLDYYVKENLKNDVSMAMDEVILVKRKIRTLFNNSKR